MGADPNSLIIGLSSEAQNDGCGQSAVGVKNQNHLFAVGGKNPQYLSKTGVKSRYCISAAAAELLPSLFTPGPQRTSGPKRTSGHPDPSGPTLTPDSPATSGPSRTPWSLRMSGWPCKGGRSVSVGIAVPVGRALSVGRALCIAYRRLSVVAIRDEAAAPSSLYPWPLDCQLLDPWPLAPSPKYQVEGRQ